MSGSSIFQNIESVLFRIDEIKRKYGVQRKITYPGFNNSFEQKLQSAETKAERVTQKTEEKSEGPVPAVQSGEKGTSPKSTGGLEEIIKVASQKYRIPESLIRAVIKQESNFDQTAVSNKGAMGLMQIMPDTAKLLGVEDAFNAEENIFGGTRYLRELINVYEGNLNKALAAYNAGPGRVGEDIPDIPETKKFIQSVLDYYDTFSNHR